LQKIKYPKFLLLFLTFLLAYALLFGRDLLFLRSFLSGLGLIGSFFSGILFVYGFTAAPATAIMLLLAKQQNIFLAGVIGGLGALCGDLLIFGFIRHSFNDEIEKLSKEKFFLQLGKRAHLKAKKYLVLVIAAVIIASPLPDEIGISLLATTTKIPAKTFSIISFCLNTLGIFLILLIGQSL